MRDQVPEVVGQCAGSRQSPPWPLDLRRPSMATCPTCGKFVAVFMRRMDWSKAEHLYMADHSPLASDDSEGTRHGIE